MGIFKKFIKCVKNNLNDNDKLSEYKIFEDSIPKNCKSCRYNKIYSGYSKPYCSKLNCFVCEEYVCNLYKLYFKYVVKSYEEKYGKLTYRKAEVDKNDRNR